VSCFIFTNEASFHYMRLFTALDLPEAIRDRFAELQTPEALSARWTSPDQFHVTVRFIGNATTEEARRYEAATTEEARRYEAALSQIDAGSVECVPYGLDALPSRRDPSVLIVGLERTDDLLRVYRTVSEALEREGVDPEDRSYRPHVTLARLGDVSASAVHTFLDNHDAPLPAFSVDTLHLYESTLTSAGANHERRASFPLAR